MVSTYGAFDCEMNHVLRYCDMRCGKIMLRCGVDTNDEGVRVKSNNGSELALL